MWHCVIDLGSRLIVKEYNGSQVDNPACLYQSRDKASAEKQAIRLSCSTGRLYCRECVPAVSTRGLEVKHTPSNRYSDIQTRQAYAWERI